tara:strand:- start:19 stop:762 length:744 start_codon:yes stop_codon:yes gene_type:complete
MLLITGSRGTLGTEIRGLFEGSCATPTSHEMDITNFISICKTFQKTKPSIVLHLAAKTDVSWCEDPSNHREVMDVNYEGTRNIREAADLYGVKKLIYVSTDYVYEKDRGGHREGDNPKPFCFYGFSKLAGESVISPSDLIIRTSFKPRSFFEKQGSFFGDSYTSSLFTKDLAKIIVDLINYSDLESISGVLNIGSYRRSYYDIARKVNPQCGVVSKESIKLPYTYPKDVSMDISKWNKVSKSLYNIN